ncbi:hypothetical protein CB1_001001004 [Camelus ferus]|nr:hypothetical protein CB1_001001004 [Camelus ferus]
MYSLGRAAGQRSCESGWGSVFQVLKSFYNKTYFERHGTFMAKRVMLLLWSCTVCMFPLGGSVGSLVSVDKCGR